MTYEEWGELLKQTGDEEDFQPLSIDKLYADWTADRDYQRRHRKWALREARRLRGERDNAFEQLGETDYADWIG